MTRFFPVFPLKALQGFRVTEDRQGRFLMRYLDPKAYRALEGSRDWKDFGDFRVNRGDRVLTESPEGRADTDIRVRTESREYQDYLERGVQMGQKDPLDCLVNGSLGMRANTVSGIKLSASLPSVLKCLRISICQVLKGSSGR